MTMPTEPMTRPEAEDFLFAETALLDEWRLEEWFKLIDEPCQYLVPSLSDRDGDPTSSLFLVADDYRTLRSRVTQLMGRSVWAENPRSRTRHQVTNVRVLESDGASALITANFTVWRFQQGASDAYVGRYLHRLVRTAEGWKFRERRCELDLESLRPHGKLSIIL